MCDPCNNHYPEKLGTMAYFVVSGYEVCWLIVASSVWCFSYLQKSGAIIQHFVNKKQDCTFYRLSIPSGADRAWCRNSFFKETLRALRVVYGM